jgi:hypothetical protein
MFTKNPFDKRDEVADLIGNILEADYKVKKEELKGNQHKIDMNKNNKVDAHDFKLLRAKGASQKDEEIDPNKTTTDTLRGRAVGKGANPFLSQKVFMDVPDNVKEEAEQIDELSSGTIDSYRKKLGAKIDTTRTTRPSLQAAIKAKNAPIQAKIHNALMKQHQAIRRERGMSEGVSEGLDEMDKTQTPPGRDGDIDWTKKQIHLGPERMMKAKDVAKHALKALDKTMKKSTPKKKGVTEEVEQIDELNKDTLYSYNKKAGADVEKKDKSLGQLIRKGDSAGANKTARQLNNRLAGQERAEKRLNKEEVEQVDERTLTPGETSEKERIVKGMKKSLSGFKQRYGERAKSVMYATATKAAKKD